MALKNDGTLVVWGDNSSGQTNIPAEQPTAVIGGSPPLIQTNFYPPIVFKLIAAGGNHTMAAIWSPLVQYPIDVSKDLLLIFNTNSVDSWNVCRYYTNNRPMVANANILGIGCTTNETAYPVDFTNDIEVPIQNWLALNPTKRPAYVVLFQAFRPGLTMMSASFRPTDTGLTMRQPRMARPVSNINSISGAPTGILS